MEMQNRGKRKFSGIKYRRAGGVVAMEGAVKISSPSCAEGVVCSSRLKLESRRVP